MRQKITSHLWFDKEAKEAAEFYTSIFADSKIKDATIIHNTPSGDTDVITIEILGQEFTLINAGPLFKFNPSISFLVACKTKEEVDALWNELSRWQGAYGYWRIPVQRKMSAGSIVWAFLQLMFFGDNVINQRITPTLMFVGKVGWQSRKISTSMYQSFTMHLLTIFYVMAK